MSRNPWEMNDDDYVEDVRPGVEIEDRGRDAPGPPMIIPAGMCARGYMAGQERVVPKTVGLDVGRETILELKCEDGNQVSLTVSIGEKSRPAGGISDLGTGLGLVDFFLIEYGIGGTNRRFIVDAWPGQSFNLECSYLRITGFNTDTLRDVNMYATVGYIPGTFGEPRLTVTPGATFTGFMVPTFHLGPAQETDLFAMLDRISIAKNTDAGTGTVQFRKGAAILYQINIVAGTNFYGPFPALPEMDNIVFTQVAAWQARYLLEYKP